MSWFFFFIRFIRTARFLSLQNKITKFSFGLAPLRMAWMEFNFRNKQIKKKEKNKENNANEMKVFRKIQLDRKKKRQNGN